MSAIGCHLNLPITHTSLVGGKCLNGGAFIICYNLKIRCPLKAPLLF